MERVMPVSLSPPRFSRPPRSPLGVAQVAVRLPPSHPQVEGLEATASFQPCLLRGLGANLLPARPSRKLPDWLLRQAKAPADWSAGRKAR